MSPNEPMNDDYTPSSQMTDDHIAEAFRDLSRRAGTVPVDNGPHLAAGARARRGRRTNPFGADSRLIPALAFAVLAAVAGFGAWQLLPDEDSGSTDIATDGSLTDDGTADNNGDSDGAITTDDGTDSTDTTDDNNGDAVPVVG